MFKKFARIENRTERLEIFSLLRFNLLVCLRLAELLALALLIAGLGWFIGEPLTARGGRPGGILAIILMLGLVELARLPFLAALSALAADFGLDPRPFRLRLAQAAGPELRRLLAVGAVSALLYWGLTALNLWLWTLAAFLLGAGLVLLNAFHPRLLRPETRRGPRDGELPPTLAIRLDHWAAKTGLSARRLLIATDFSPELKAPALSGFGPTQRLIIPERALAAFTPREMSLLVVMAAVGALVKVSVKMLLLRFCALAVAVPLAAILISTVGTGWWGYPLATPPTLVVLVWLAVWLGLGVAEFTIRLTRRILEPQLAAAATTILKDDEALVSALTTMAEKNLEEENPPAWRECLRSRPSLAVFLKRARYHQHLAKFNG